MFFGLVLLIVGIIFLLEKLDIISGSAWGYIWPVLLIALGLSIILGRGRGWGCYGWRSRRYPPEDKEQK